MHCLITWPTGTGKTWTARQEAAEVLSSGGRVLVCVPLKALAAELELEWGAALPGVTVRAFTSDTRARAYQDAQVLILTPERLDLISRAWRRHHHWLAAARLLIADEVHLLADPVRGPRLDGAVTRLRAAYPLLRVMALSATVGDPETLRAWLGAAFATEAREAVVRAILAMPDGAQAALQGALVAVLAALTAWLPPPDGDLPPPPAFPYRWLGQLAQGDAPALALLGGPQNSLAVPVNGLIDGQWKLQSMQPDLLVLVWLPTGQTVNLKNTP